MAVKLNIDTGVKEYEVNGGGVLRFNPSDLNVYERFLEAQDKIAAIETELVERGKALPESAGEQQTGEAVVKIMAEADRRAKELLAWVFAGNDFDALLGGVNLMAVGTNGERVVTNLFAALTPILEQGAQACADEKTGRAVAQAKANRAQRRAAKG